MDEVTGYVSLRWDIEARDWICVETGGMSEVSLLRLRCASLCLFTMDRCEALT
jgi:hypothetical protein